MTSETEKLADLLGRVALRDRAAFQQLYRRLAATFRDRPAYPEGSGRGGRCLAGGVRKNLAQRRSICPAGGKSAGMDECHDAERLAIDTLRRRKPSGGDLDVAELLADDSPAPRIKP